MRGEKEKGYLQGFGQEGSPLCSMFFKIYLRVVSREKRNRLPVYMNIHMYTYSSVPY